MGFFGDKAEQAKQKAKQKAKGAVRTAVLGADEIVCVHCQQPRSRAQVRIHGSKHRRPLVFTCINSRQCTKDRERNASSGTVRITREVRRRLQEGGGLDG